VSSHAARQQQQQSRLRPHSQKVVAYRTSRPEKKSRTVHAYAQTSNDGTTRASTKCEVQTAATSAAPARP